MKKSTCKTLLWVGIFWVILVAVTSSIIAIKVIRIDYFIGIFEIILFTLLFGLPGWILIIIAITKWDSEKEKRKR